MEVISRTYMQKNLHKRMTFQSSTSALEGKIWIVVRIKKKKIFEGSELLSLVI